MLCPVCRVDLVIVEWDDVELDVCVDGHGAWFDADELRQLFANAGAPGELGAIEARLATLPVHEHGERRRCPRCRARMMHVAASYQPDRVILDRCPKGHGLWFDDGELEALVETSIPADDAELARVRSYLIQFQRPSQGSKEPEA